jgi:uncharacterized cupin superfamily protein
VEGGPPARFQAHRARLNSYKARHAHSRLTEGTAARKLAAGVTVIPPGKRACPYHLHHAQDLKYLAIGTTDEPEICEYPDSGKFLAESGLASQAPFGVIGRTATKVDYWDGEE